MSPCYPGDLREAEAEQVRSRTESGVEMEAQVRNRPASLSQWLALCCCPHFTGVEPEPASVAGGSFFLLGRWSACGSKDHCEWSSLPIESSGRLDQPASAPTPGQRQRVLSGGGEKGGVQSLASLTLSKTWLFVSVIFPYCFSVFNLIVFCSDLYYFLTLLALGFSCSS